jgi:hypothetical protein
MIVLMMERVQIKELASVGFVINRKTRLNFYKEADKTKLWTGELFDSLIVAINEFKKEEKKKRKSLNKLKNSKCLIL